MEQNVVKVENLEQSVISRLLESNSVRYNMEKCVEECLELAEVLMKKVLKKNGPKEPSNESIIEELGDVQIRVKILSEMLGKDKVEERVNYKLNKFDEYLNNHQYIGSI